MGWMDGWKLTTQIIRASQRFTNTNGRYCTHTHTHTHIQIYAHHTYIRPHMAVTHLAACLDFTYPAVQLGRASQPSSCALYSSPHARTFASTGTSIHSASQSPPHPYTSTMGTNYAQTRHVQHTPTHPPTRSPVSFLAVCVGVCGGQTALSLWGEDGEDAFLTRKSDR